MESKEFLSDLVEISGTTQRKRNIGGGRAAADLVQSVLNYQDRKNGKQNLVLNVDVCVARGKQTRIK